MVGVVGVFGVVAIGCGWRCLCWLFSVAVFIAKVVFAVAVAAVAVAVAAFVFAAVNDTVVVIVVVFVAIAVAVVAGPPSLVKLARK